MSSPNLPRGLPARLCAHAGFFLLLLIAVAAAYAPALGGGLVWDDEAHVTEPALRSVHGLTRIWFELGATQQYYPVLHSAFWVEHRLWGNAPTGYHAVNLVLHAAAAALFAALLGRLGVAGAALAAGIFALHPIEAESVAWISEQKNTLSAVFYLSAALCYLGFEETRHRRAYAVATALFVLALLTKSVTATLPAALLVLAWWRRGRVDLRTDVRPLLPWFVLAAAMGTLTAWVERRLIGAEGAEFQLGALERLLLAGRVVWFYLGKILGPVDLMFVYPRWRIDPGSAWSYAYPTAALAALLLVWRIRRWSRGPLAAALLFGGTLFPVLGFVNVYPFRFSFVADHFQYLAGLAMIALAAAGLTSLARSWPGSVRLGLAAGLLLVLGAATWRQAADYRDAETLYRATLARNPECWLCQNNLGNLLSQSGRAADALPLFEAALRSGKDVADVHSNFGGALALLGRLDEAAAHYEAALQLRPQYAKAESGLGDVLRRAGRPAEAIVRYENALRLQPGSADAENNLGVALAGAGRVGEAVARYEAALRIVPGHADAHNNLGGALLALGRTAEAIPHFEAALAARPDHADAHVNLALALTAAARPDDAIRHYQSALRLDPRHPDAGLNLGNLLFGLGRLPEAVARYEAALEAQPDSPHLLGNLASALAESGRTEEAIVRYRESLRLSPGDAARHRYLGLTLADAGRFDEAQAELRRALELKPDDTDTRAALDEVQAKARAQRAGG